MKELMRRFWRWLCRIAAWFGRALDAPDSRDWHVYGGLLIAGVGGWLLSPARTLMVIGGALVIFGLFGGLLDRSMLRTEKDE